MERRDTRPAYREMLTWMATESGIDTRRTDNLVRPGRVRKGKKRSKESQLSKAAPANVHPRVPDFERNAVRARTGHAGLLNEGFECKAKHFAQPWKYAEC